MPAAFIEGTETMVVYCLCLLFPTRAPLLFSLFAIAVTCNIVYRLVYASHVLHDFEHTTVSASTHQSKTSTATSASSYADDDS
jgi:hypothetical protein